MESKILSLQEKLQKIITEFCKRDLLDREYIIVEVKNLQILGSDSVLHLDPEVKVTLRVE